MKKIKLSKFELNKGDIKGCLNLEVKVSGNGACVYIPKKYIGKEVCVVFTRE